MTIKTYLVKKNTAAVDNVYILHRNVVLEKGVQQIVNLKRKKTFLHEAFLRLCVPPWFHVFLFQRTHSHSRFSAIFQKATTFWKVSLALNFKCYFRLIQFWKTLSINRTLPRAFYLSAGETLCYQIIVQSTVFEFFFTAIIIRVIRLLSDIYGSNVIYVCIQRS